LLTDEPEQIVYVMNQRLIELESGRIVLPVAGRDPRVSVDTYREGAEPCMAFCYLSDDEGSTWRRSLGAVREPSERGAQEPVVAEYAPDRLVMLHRSGLGTHQASYSEDGGETWTALAATSLTAACSPLALKRLPDGRLFVVYNHAVPLFEQSYFPRNPLVYATSWDAHAWSDPILIDDQPGQQLIYPSVTITNEGLLVTYCACYDAGNGGFSHPSDAWRIGGGRRCLVEVPL
jgi:hypothetical protein